MKAFLTWYMVALGGVAGFWGGRVLAQPAPDPVTSQKSAPQEQAVAPALAIAPFDAEQARRHQEEWAAHLCVPVEISNSIGMKLVLIPPGEFMMGSPEHDQLAGRDEKPQHHVRITKPFYLSVYEVTQGQYERVTGDNLSHFSKAGKGADKVASLDTRANPVETVSWNEAATFCGKLSKATTETAAHRIYRLPTEAEWEYACRAGTTAAAHFGDLPASVRNVRHLSDHAWWGAHVTSVVPFTPCHVETYPHPVGKKRPNAWGLYDMYGNVEEWCRDSYDHEYYVVAPTDDPQGPPAGSGRITRGGSWMAPHFCCRSARRISWKQDTRQSNIGFRIVAVLSEPESEK